MNIDHRYKGLIVSMIFLQLIVFGCSEEENYPNYNPPSDHTVSMEGVMHKSGLGQPTANCVACHGDNLEGGTAQVSCYECHGKKW